MRRWFPRMLLTGACAISLVLQSAVICPAVGDDADRQKKALLDKIKKLEEDKLKEQERLAKQTDNTKPTGEVLDTIIDKYEKILDKCSGKKSDRCADVMVTLGDLFYQQAKDNYIEARAKYEKEMTIWEAQQKGAEPVNPIPDYSKPLKMYQRFIQDYPDHPKVCEAYYQQGSINLVMGALDVSEQAFEQLVAKFPDCRRSSAAYYRLADFAYINHDYSKALKDLEKVNLALVAPEVVEGVQYRKSELLYNVGDFEAATEGFFEYREKCESGEYRKCDLKDESLEFMAIAFSDMPEGADKAIKFFKKVGGRPYEDAVIYTVGMKNRVHGQYDDAILALQTALKKYPYYKDAPLAEEGLIECYLIKKKYDEANQSRERLIDYYQPGTEWYQKNADQKAVIEQANSEVKRALAQVAVYYHSKAQKDKTRSSYEAALKRYVEFFKRFPDDKWMMYELSYNVAEIYSTLDSFALAAKYYDYVAMQDLSTYPKFAVDLDTLGLDQEEIEKMKQEREKQHASISQEDAGYNAIVALDNARKKAIAKKGLTEENAYDLPETKTFLDYISKFQQRFPQSANAADVLYLGANVHYGAKSYQNAIAEFQHIVNNYPASPLAVKSLRLLANCYVSLGDFDLALAKYRELSAKTKPGTKEYEEIVDLAAGAMYKKAENMAKDGNYVGAADAYKAIGSSFPNSKVAARGWFEAGDCYDKAKNADMAAATFEEFTKRFPKDELTEKAFMRAAETYKTLKHLDQAAKVYIQAAKAITKADFAIPSLAAAAQCYSDMQNFDLAGKTFQLIYEGYASDPKTPQALYNAGLLFEKGKYYDQAINVYSTLSQHFAQSEYAAEAFYSIGLCQEKLGQPEAMAQTFTEFANKYPNDRFKQVEALVKAADAYRTLKKTDEAAKLYTLATVVYKEENGKADMDPATVAKAHYMLGDIAYQEFLKLQLDGKDEKAIRSQVQDKTKGLENAAKPFAEAIKIGVEEWTVRATYMIGQGFVDMAKAVSEQRLLGSKDQQVAAKIRILSSLDKYYSNAMKYFAQNIEWAYDQGVQSSYVDTSRDRFMELAFRKGHLLEDVGILFRDAPVPGNLSPQEKQDYKDLLQEKYLASLDAALPKYEEAISDAVQEGIGKSRWIDSTKDAISRIKPDSKALEIQLVDKAPKQHAEVTKEEDKIHHTRNPNTPGVQLTGDSQLDRNVKRIKNIAAMDIPIDDKVTQIGRVEAEAQRNIVLEEEKIKELKEQLAHAGK